MIIRGGGKGQGIFELFISLFRRTQWTSAKKNYLFCFAFHCQLSGSLFPKPNICSGYQDTFVHFYYPFLRGDGSRSSGKAPQGQSQLANFELFGYILVGTMETVKEF
jgi:hypothetical protein